jgi:YegS/Rv2252/BmrU family lipid kinase
MKAFVVLNPVAGRTKAAEVRRAIDRHFKQEEWQVTIHETTAGESIADLVRGVVDQGLDVVIAAGGDGTVSAVVDGLVSSGVPLGILPAGTTNVVAQELGVPSGLDRACQLIAGEHIIRAIDALQMEDQFFVLSIGLGLDAQAMESTTQEQKRRFGKLAYIWVILKLIFGIQPHAFTIIADGRQRRVKAADILMTNVSTLTRPFRWGPHIAPDDGQIDIVIMRARNMIDVLGVIYDILVPGRPRRNRNLRFWSAQSSIIVIAERPLPAQGDGDLLGKKQSAEVQIWPGSVQVIAPVTETGRRWPSLPLVGK